MKTNNAGRNTPPMQILAGGIMSRGDFVLHYKTIIAVFCLLLSSFFLLVVFACLEFSAAVSDNFQGHIDPTFWVGVDGSIYC